MEKIKSLLSPGKDRDNEQLYNSGENTNTGHPGTGGVSGEGSHLANKTTTGHTTGHTTGGSNVMPGGYPSDSTTGVMSGSNTSTTPNLVGDLGVAAGNHGIGHSEHTSGTGLSGHQGTGYNTDTSSSTTAGPHSSSLQNQLDPRVDSDNPRAVGGTGTASNLHGAGYPNTSSSTTAGHSAIDGSQSTSHAGNAPRSFPLGSNTSSSTTAGPHSSSLENKIDPRIDSDQSRTVGSQSSSAHPVMDRSYPIQSGYGNSTQPSSHNLSGHDAATMGTGGVAYSAISHHENQSNVASNPPTSGTGYDNSAAHTGSSGHNLGRDAAVLGAGGAAGSAIHHHQNQSNVGSNTSSTGIGSSGLHGTSGPHQTETANRLDPHVSGGGVRREDAIHHHEHQSTGRKPVGGGAEEADSSHRDIGITSADATRIKDTELAPNPELTGHNSSTSHTGRNAALGAGAGLGAAGLASHEHGSHHTGQHGIGGSSGIPHSGTGTAHNSGLTGTSANNYPNTGVARDVNTTGQSSHHGTGIAGTGAALGAAGIAKHEHDSHHTGQPTGKFGVGNTHGTTHQSGIMGTSHNSHPNACTNLDRDANTTGHRGRDATLGAGAGLGAVGLAKHEHDRHQAERSGGLGSNPTTVGTTTTTTTHHGHHDNRETSNASHSTTAHHGHHDNRDATIGAGQSTTHHGRDAALGTGASVGAAGLAKHEHDKHQAERSHTIGNAHPTTGTGTNTSATQHDLKTNFGNYPAADQSTAHGATTGTGIVREAEESMRNRGVQPDRTQHTRDHEKDQKEHFKEMKKEQKHEQKYAHEADKHEKKDHKGGLFSFLHRDKSKKYTDEEEKEFDRQEREHHSSQSHHGRDAVGGVALGAGAAGAYEANKHYGQSSDTNKSLPTAPGNHGIGTGAGTQNALAGQGHSTTGQGNIGSGTVGLPGTTHSTTSQHPGHDATTMTGSGVGATTLGEHEHNKHYTTSGNQSSVPHSGTNLGTHSGTHTGAHPTGQHGLASDQPRLSEADFDQEGNPIGSHHSHLPPAYGTEARSDGRNRLHKDPPSGHPAAQAMAGQTHDVPGRHENLTGDNNGLASDSGVKNAGGNTY